MEIRFFIDPETNLHHIFKHKVEEFEVYEVFYNIPVEDWQGRNNSRVAIGQTDSGRYI